LLCAHGAGVNGGQSRDSADRYRAGVSGLLALSLVATTLFAYSAVRHHPFIVLDDRGYVVTNTHIQQLNWETVKWSFTTFRASNWHPVTWLSHAVDYHFFLLDAGRHRDVNLLLHAVNALLLFWILLRATGYAGRSFAVAALFALHPINVESVAWIAERKNLLSMFFFLLALGAYRWYASRARVDRYLAVAVLFAFGLMSKAQIVTLPFVLLLWDYWPLRRMFRAPDTSASTDIPAKSFSWLALEKLPLLALSAASAIVTVKAQQEGGTIGGVLNSFSFPARMGNAVVAYVAYLRDAIWPSRLAFFYPHAAASAWPIAAAFLLLLAITAVAVADRRRRYFAVGWLWFLGTLVPMIGLIQVGSQSMADRYAYLPLVGLFITIVWGVADCTEGLPLTRVWLPASTVAILSLLALATRRQVSYWADDMTLWSHTAGVTRNNWMAENQIGELLLMQGDAEAAIPHFRAATAMEPRFPFAHLHVGVYEEEHGRPREAIQQLQTVLDLTQFEAARTPVIRGTALVYMSYAYNQLGDYANQQKYLSLAAQQQQP